MSKRVRGLKEVYGPFERLDDNTFSANVCCGARINDAVAETIKVARALGAAVQFEFNGVTVAVRSDSNPELILRDFRRARDSRGDKNVGPYPNPVLTDDELANNARIEAENIWRGGNAMLEGALSVAPIKMTLKDRDGWNKTVAANTDDYGNAVIKFAERWARLMEGRMANGGTLEACAEETSSLADNEGITGFMYGCAVSILSQVWIHGEELRHWHNLKTQIWNEGEKANKSGGVLNPALLRLG